MTTLAAIKNWLSRVNIWGLIAFATVLALSVTAFLEAPFARISAGPSPNLNEAITDVNDPNQLDPTFGNSGTWYASTVRAKPLKWWELVAAKLGGEEAVAPVAVDKKSLQSAYEAMDRSVIQAGEIADEWLETFDTYDTNYEIDLGKIGGTSAGLLMFLAFVDATTDGDLTGGKNISGTGTLNDLDEVGGVTGTYYKAADLAANGAIEVFFTPIWSYDDAKVAAEGSPLQVVAVRNIPEALNWLCTNGGRSSVCEHPSVVTAPLPETYVSLDL